MKSNWNTEDKFAGDYTVALNLIKQKIDENRSNPIHFIHSNRI